MKKLYFFLAMFFWISLQTTQINAQAWGTTGPFFDLFSVDEESTFNLNLDILTDSLLQDRFDGLQLSDFDLGMASDSMFHYLNAGSGSVEPTDSLTGVWQSGQNDLDGFIDSANLSSEDSVLVYQDFGHINDVWNNEYDSLNAVIGTYQDTITNLDEVGMGDGVIRFDQYAGKWHQAYLCLLNNGLPMAQGASSHAGVNNIDIEGLLDTTLLSSLLDFEIAFGQEWAEVNFFNESYNVRSSLLRIASVPKYNQIMEMRWALEGSFFNNDEDILNLTELSNNNSLAEGMNPFICSANFALMYLPSFGSIGDNGTFRLYTSIGIDLGVYAPSHADYEHPSPNARQDFSDRVGLTSGYGPQIGAGFVVNYSDFSFYSYGTVARGEVIGESEYVYNATTINAGIRYGDAINIRYTLGDSSWAPDGNKSAKFSRFTIGVILDEIANP